MFALGVALLCLLSAFLAACLLLAWRAPLMAQRSKAHVLLLGATTRRSLFRPLSASLGFPVSQRVASFVHFFVGRVSLYRSTNQERMSILFVSHGNPLGI